MNRGSGVTVAVVTWNSAAVIGGFLESLPGAMSGVDSWEVVVADNGSSDDTVDVANAANGRVRILRRGSNDGYAAGLNDAVANRSFDGPLVLANPDTRPGPGNVATLLGVLEREGAGIAVPRLSDPSGGLLFSQRRDPTVVRAAGEALLGGRLAGRVDALGEVVTDPRRYEGPRPVDWATGAFMVVSQRCWDAVGPWDDSFFLYSEETDFCLRARDAGFAIWFEPRAEVVHVGGESRTSPLLYSLVVVNKVRLYGRRHGRPSTLAFRAASLLKEILRTPTGETHRLAARALLGRVDPARELRG